jgi:hypothetical protein
MIWISLSSWGFAGNSRWITSLSFSRWCFLACITFLFCVIICCFVVYFISWISGLSVVILGLCWIVCRFTFCFVNYLAIYEYAFLIASTRVVIIALGGCVSGAATQYKNGEHGFDPTSSVDGAGLMRTLKSNKLLAVISSEQKWLKLLIFNLTHKIRANR